jgi:hypothetical protein
MLALGMPSEIYITIEVAHPKSNLTPQISTLVLSLGWKGMLRMSVFGFGSKLNQVPQKCEACALSSEGCHFLHFLLFEWVFHRSLSCKMKEALRIPQILECETVPSSTLDNKKSRGLPQSFVYLAFYRSIAHCLKYIHHASYTGSINSQVYCFKIRRIWSSRSPVPISGTNRSYLGEPPGLPVAQHECRISHLDLRVERF